MKELPMFQEQEQEIAEPQEMSLPEETEPERYKYFMRPEPLEDLGPIETLFDPIFGKETRRRMVTVGMLRNDPNPQRSWCYLEPFPHLRIEKAKPLMGWYQDKLGEGHRPRPCMTEAILTQPYGGWCYVGCGFSLPAGEPIATPDGWRNIEEIREGEMVWGQFPDGVRKTAVAGHTKHWKAEGYLILTLSDGRELRMTNDHPIYSKQRGWIRAEEVSSEDEFVALEGSQLAAKKASYSLVPGLSGFYPAHGAESGSSVPPVHIDHPNDVRRPDGKTERREGSATNQNSPMAGVKFGATKRKHGKTGGMAAHARMESGAGYCDAEARSPASTIKTRAIRRPQRPNLFHALRVGAACSGMAGRSRIQLGVRTESIAIVERAALFAGLSTGRWPMDRSEGLFGPAIGGENSAGAQRRAPGSVMESKENGTAPRATAIRRMEKGCWVYDIQTDSGNFFQRGILVHNCYINAGARGWRSSGLVTVVPDYPAQVNAALKRMRIGAAGYLSSFTDPFLSLEGYYHNSERTASTFLRHGLPVFFLSRLSYPGWAFDILQAHPHSYAQKSLNTGSDKDYKLMSPGALPLEEHIQEVGALRKAGIYTSIQVNPVIPGVTSMESLKELFDRLGAVGNNHVIVKFVEAAYSWVPKLKERLQARFGAERVAAFSELFTQNIGGQKTVAEDYRLGAHEVLRKAASDAGMTYATCYEYKAQAGTRGVSVGPEFLTASQCHGPAVPIFERKTPEAAFTAFEYCPPCGCLGCPDEHPEGVPCGNEKMARADALRMSDYKKPLRP